MTRKSCSSTWRNPGAARRFSCFLNVALAFMPALLGFSQTIHHANEKRREQSRLFSSAFFNSQFLLSNFHFLLSIFHRATTPAQRESRQVQSWPAARRVKESVASSRSSG